MIFILFVICFQGINWYICTIVPSCWHCHYRYERWTKTNSKRTSRTRNQTKAIEIIAEQSELHNQRIGSIRYKLPTIKLNLQTDNTILCIDWKISLTFLFFFFKIQINSSALTLQRKHKLFANEIVTSRSVSNKHFSAAKRAESNKYRRKKIW